MRFLLVLPILVLAACNATTPPRDTSTLNKINEELKQGATPAAQAPLPDAVSNALLPPLRIPLPKNSAKQLEQRFDLVVNDAPANQVLMGIVSGTRYSMLVHPDVKGNISVNLKDVTVFEALDAVREMYGYEYRVEGARIYVTVPSMQIRVYKVNYIVGLRRGRSDIAVNSGAAGSTSGSSSSGSSTGAGITQTQASALASSQKGDFWSEVEDAIRVSLNCKIPNMTSVTTSTSDTNNAAGVNRAMSTLAETQYGDRARGADGCADGRGVVVNQMSGTILVRGMPQELRLVEGLLRTMQVNVEKQVILEAKIIDVQLNSGSQQGINWSLFHSGRHLASVGADTSRITESGTGRTGGLGFLNDSTSTSTSVPVVFPTLNDVLGSGLVGVSGTAFSAGLGVAFQIHNFSAMLDFLQSQGEVHVLSSPRIATINNQKAVLKVGRDEQFVTGFETNNNTTNTTGGTTVNQPTPVYSTFFSGISLDVTPQIDDEGNITLHVHPLVSEVSEVEKRTMNNQTLPFASNKISETDSVVKVKDGQIVVIGGLMTDSYEDTRNKVPGLSNVPGIGAAFRKNNQQATKRELVILIKPTVIHDETNWADDIAATQQRIEGMNKATEAR